jgi:hypothetical protein
LRACWRLLNAAVIVKESRACFEDGENAVDAAEPKGFWQVEIAPNYITDFNNTSRRRGTSAHESRPSRLGRAGREIVTVVSGRMRSEGVERRVDSGQGPVLPNWASGWIIMPDMYGRNVFASRLQHALVLVQTTRLPTASTVDLPYCRVYIKHAQGIPLATIWWV